MKFAFSAVAVSAALVASPAFAQDAGTNDNGGIKAGAVFGYDVISIETPTEVERESGAVYGLTAGYDVDTGNTIIGLEAEVSDTTISDDIGDSGLDIYGGVRVGMEVDEVGIAYLKAGYSRVDIEAADNLEGVRLGAGYERRFGNLFGRFEYRYTTYNLGDVIDESLNGNRNQLVVTFGAAF